MANKKAVLGRPLPDASVPRNAFDRSKIRAMHYALGALNVAGWFPCIAGSNIKCNRKIFQRTADVNTAAFPTIDTHIQWYFVPYRQLVSVWDDFKLNIQDINSSAIGSTTPETAPYANLSSDIKALLANPGFVTDGAGQSFVYGALRLLNQCGYGNYKAASYIYDQVDLNLLPLLAYQKIYYDHFRNTAYESNDNEAYNMDKYYTSANNYDGHVDSATDLTKILTLRYVNYRNDYFNNIYPALNYVQSLPTGTSWQLPISLVGAGQISGFNIVNASDEDSVSSDVNLYFDGSGNPVSLNNDTTPILGSASAPSNGHLSNLRLGTTPSVSFHHKHTLPTIGVTSSQIGSFFNVQQIRAMFALDKLQRSSAYAPKHAKEQYEARFGIKFRNNPNESLYLGSMKNDVVIGEVTSTANTQQTSGGVTTGDSLGAIGGKGIGSSDWDKNSISFNCAEDGIVMAVMYSTIRSMYDSDRVDSYLLKTSREDFFQPEYMDLGLQPITIREFGYHTLGNLYPSQAVLVNAIMGYVPRYQEYKLSVDENLGLFADSSSQLSAFVNHTNKKFVVPSSWTGGLPASFFKVKPTDLDGITSLNYDDTNGIYQSDQFFTWLQLGFDVNQNMSVHGQPRL